MQGKGRTNMDEGKYHFERLTPINDVDLNVYEEAIIMCLIIQIYEMLLFQVHIVPVKVAF